MKTISWIAVGAFAFIALAYIARPETETVAPSEEPGALSSTESMFDFGTISMASGDVSRIFAIRNDGEAPVAITKIYTSCMCTRATLVLSGKRRGPFGMPGHGVLPVVRETLAPGAEATVEVVFDPTAHGPAGIGRIERTVTIENDGGSPLRLSFSASVTP